MEPTLKNGGRLRWPKAVAVGIALWGAAVGCGSDDEGEDTFYCCAAQALCRECGCGPNQSIANSGDQQRCWRFLNEAEWECVGYTEAEAKNSCQGR